LLINERGICTEPLPSYERGYTYRHTALWDGFMKYAAEMASSAIIYIPGFVKIASPIQMLIHTDTQTARNWHTPPK
jgi:hypothetical protein